MKVLINPAQLICTFKATPSRAHFSQFNPQRSTDHPALVLWEEGGKISVLLDLDVRYPTPGILLHGEDRHQKACAALQMTEYRDP